MTVKKYIFMVLLFLFNSAVGQELYGKYLTTKDGLLSKECYDIEKTADGYLLISTQYGPMKYDGEKLTPICLNLAQMDRIIYDFEKGPNGTIYFITAKNKIYKLKNNDAVFLTELNNTSINKKIILSKLTRISSGFQVSSSIKLYNFQYSLKENKILIDFVKQGAESDEIIYNPHKKSPILNSKYLVGNVRTCKVIFEHLNQSITLKSPINTEKRDCFEKYRGNEYVLINNNFFIIQNKKIKNLGLNNILSYKIRRNQIWLATLNGLYELDLNGTIKNIHFKGNIIGGIVPIFSNGLLISFNNNGIFICPDVKDRIIQNKRLNSVGIHQNSVLFGSKDGCIFDYSQNQLKLLAEAPAREDDNNIYRKIQTIDFINNHWIIGYPTGIYILDRKKQVRSHFVNSIFRNSTHYFRAHGEYFNVGMHGIGTITENTNRLTNLPRTQTLLYHNDTNVWFGTKEGLFIYNPKHNTLKPHLNFFKNVRINSIQKNGNQYILGTQYNGIFIVAKNKILQNIPSPGNALYKAKIVKNHLYVGCNNGIFKLNLKHENHLKWIKLFSGETDFFDVGNECIYIGYENDVIIKSLNHLKKPYDFKINSIQIDGVKKRKLPSTLNFNSTINIDLDVLDFSANYTGLQMIVRGAKSYAQLIEGTEINLSGLSPGEYHIKIYPLINKEVDYSKTITFNFIIKPPFTQSILFFLLVGIVIILILSSTILIVLLRRRKRSQEKSELLQRLEEYKMAALKAQVNPHFLSNGLAAIQALILKNETDLSAQYLAKFSLLMRKILHYSEHQFVSLKDEFSVIEIYLEMEQLRFNNRFILERNITLEEYQLNTIQVPALILQPIVENAIWHGLKKTKNIPKLIIDAKINSTNFLEIQIRDNGPGIHELQSEKTGHFSKGKHLILERIESINQRFGTGSASINYESSDNGTTVILFFKTNLQN